MTTRMQVSERDSEPAFYVVPADLWKVVREATEDAEDAAVHAAAHAAAIAADDGVTYPAAVVHAMREVSTLCAPGVRTVA